MRYFITYGDEKYKDARTKIVREAEATAEFDKILAFDRSMLTPELLNTEIIDIPRGGGLWSWKPDIIWQTMQQGKDGDAIVYCDSGCSLQPAKEWSLYWAKLKSHDIIAQRIFSRNDKWTRKEVIEEVLDNVTNWNQCYMFQATIIIIISPFTRQFISEWRSLMINKPYLAMDVTEEERKLQHSTLIENRHDQAIYSALIYKYLNNKQTKDKIYTMWEHIENYDPIFKQAIRATRLRHGEQEDIHLKKKRMYKRLFKDYILRPFYYAPLQWWYSR